MEALFANPAFLAFIAAVGTAALDELIRQSSLSSNSILQLLGRIAKGSVRR